MKDWSDDFREHIKEWSPKLEKSGRGWWPRFLYHHTDLHNAVSILNSGVLYSRELCSDRELMVSDNADPVVLGQTDPDHLRYVRLYFRPRTPTLYNTEGIRPPDRRPRGHCPVPVYLLFDFVEVLGRDDSRFSRGTMASSRYGHSVRRDYFRKIEFADVYHDSGLGYQDTPRKREIIQRRQAEVLIPGELSLEPALRYICCRTAAERTTLLSGLEPPIEEQWRDRTRVGIDKMFFRRYPHVKSVHGSGEHLAVEVYRGDYHQPIPYTLEVWDETRLGTSGGTFGSNSSEKRFRLRGEWSPEIYAELTLFDCVAFNGLILLSDLPF